MLVLTRKLMEKLYIGDQICVTVVRLESGQVRLGIDAPRSVPVVRAELKAKPPTSLGEMPLPVDVPPTETRAIPVSSGLHRRVVDR